MLPLGTLLVLSEEGGPAEQIGRGLGWRDDPQSTPKERRTEGTLYIGPGWLNNTLKLGWWDTGNGAALQKAGSLWAGEGCIIHQSWIGKATIKGHTPHCPVPVPWGACEQNVLLETENFLCQGHIKTFIKRSSWWLFVQTFKRGTNRFCLSPFLCLIVLTHSLPIWCWRKAPVVQENHWMGMLRQASCELPSTYVSCSALHPPPLAPVHLRPLTRTHWQEISEGGGKERSRCWFFSFHRGLLQICSTLQHPLHSSCALFLRVL